MSSSDDSSSYFEIQKILDSKKSFYKGKTINSYRVQWKGYDEDESTWEPETNFTELEANVLITNFKLSRKMQKMKKKNARYVDIYIVKHILII